MSQKFIKKISDSDERVDLSGDELETDSESNFSDVKTSSSKGSESSNDLSFGTNSSKSSTTPTDVNTLKDSSDSLSLS